MSASKKTSKSADTEIILTEPSGDRPSAAPSTKSFSIRGQVIFGILVVSSLVFGAGGWAATAPLSGAVIASGSIVVDKNVKKVQHRDGGIVSKINVKNGDRVEAGQVIIELDDTQIRAELGVVRAQLTELIARKARLSAEVNGLDQIEFPQGFGNSGPQAKQVMESKRRLFAQSRFNLESRKEQLALQIEQLREEITGIKAQRDAKRDQLAILRRELAEVQKLFEKQLTSVTRVYSLQREVTRLHGEYGGLTAQTARVKGKIGEIKLQILSVEDTSRLEAQRELQTTEAKIAELSEREIAAKDRLSRTQLTAPKSGIAHELAVHTIGGVITSAETVLVIVPADTALTIEAKIAPVDIDQMSNGMPATLRFSAFNQQTTPELTGRVVHVSADVTTDEQTSQKYYSARIELDPGSQDKLGDLQLLPGMPVEAFMSTGVRTALSYLVKPVTDQFYRAFREE
jgi:HlyD family secretion protein